MQQVSDSEHQIILELFQQSLIVLGDIVEFGCYKGDTSILLARQLNQFLKEHPSTASKTIYLYDSFAGLPVKTTEDTSSIGDNFSAGSLLASKADLIRRFKKANLPLPKIKKAWFADLDPATDLPSQISFAFLDGDYYASIKLSLKLVYPKLSSGAIVLVHDYRSEALPGVARAVDEFLSAHSDFKLHLRESLAVLHFTE